MNSSSPSIAELRTVCQPEDVLGRVNAEHWAGRLYMRRLSPYVTRVLLRWGLSADAVTWLMIGSGLVACVALSFPGLLTAVVAVLLIQTQLLLDCCDGEIARWRGLSSAVGIYLDRIGHYTTEAGLVAALGVRADGGWSSIGGWTTVGLILAVLVLLVKSETDLVHVARAVSGLARFDEEAIVPRARGLRSLRQLARFVPFYRAFVAIECSLLALVAAIVDTLAGDLIGTRILVIALVPTLGVIVLGHLVSILGSRRLR
jgi:phosphatidylglycerophosphate synthase